MADDDRLLELLGQVLAPEPAEPSPERVAAVRLLAEQGSRSAARPAGPRSAARPAGSGPVSRDRKGPGRAGWLAAGGSVAAAAVVIAMLALPTLIGPDQDGGPAVARLRVALMSGNAVAVARADANLLRESDTIDGPDRNDAVATHVEAIQFLRDHPSAEAAAELPPPPPVAPRRESTPVPTSIAPTGDPVSGADTPPPASAPTMPVPNPVAPGPPGVAILGVIARLDGTFGVDFAVSGFTPDASGAPGTHSVRFSFDGGQAPTTWDGQSPWSFPVTAGLTYRQVCAHVADAAGVEDLSTGGCRDIV